MNEPRLENFLRSYEFYPNSVDFRIASSKALERFKNVQAFQLNETKNGRYQFGASKRELLLLKFDLTTRVLAEVENYCIQLYSPTKTVDDEIIATVISLFKKVDNIFYSVVFNVHKDHFDSAYTAIWYKLQTALYMQVFDTINTWAGIRIIEFFNRLVAMMCTTLQCTTLDTYELDIHMAKLGHVHLSDHGPDVIANPKIIDKARDEKLKFAYCGADDDEYCITDFMIVLTDMTNSTVGCSRQILKTRLEIYLEAFEITGIYFKNLSDSPVDKAVLELVESFGVPINYRSSLIS